MKTHYPQMMIAQAEFRVRCSTLFNMMAGVSGDLMGAA
jgi:hypothetical protein